MPRSLPVSAFKKEGQREESSTSGRSFTITERQIAYPLLKPKKETLNQLPACLRVAGTLPAEQQESDFGRDTKWIERPAKTITAVDFCSFVSLYVCVLMMGEERGLYTDHSFLLTGLAYTRNPGSMSPSVPMADQVTHLKSLVTWSPCLAILVHLSVADPFDVSPSFHAPASRLLSPRFF